MDFPGLTVARVTKLFLEFNKTQQGHIMQQHQNVGSTKVNLKLEALEVITPGLKHHNVYLWVIDATKKSMYTDQTGQFSITSSCGNRYLMVAVEMDENYIDAEPMKTQDAKELIRA